MWAFVVCVLRMRLASVMCSSKSATRGSCMYIVLRLCAATPADFQLTHVVTSERNAYKKHSSETLIKHRAQKQKAINLQNDVIVGDDDISIVFCALS